MERGGHPVLAGTVLRATVGEGSVQEGRRDGLPKQREGHTQHRPQRVVKRAGTSSRSRDMKRSEYRFEGTGRHAAGEPHPDSPTTPEPYKADPQLGQAVNLAIYLGRPLLLEGEAGSGKTRLARA